MTMMIQIEKMRQKICAVFVSLTLCLVCSMLYLNSETLPQTISAFVDYYRQRVYGDRNSYNSSWKKINYTELGFIESPHFAKYVVKMYEYLNLTSANIPSHPINSHACTNLLVKEAFKSDHRFPLNGSWLRYVFNKTTEFYHFQPNFCSFSEKDLTKSYVRGCLAKKNIRKLVTIGDSNSQRLLEAFVRVLSTSFDRCNLVAVESLGHQSDPKYYLKNVSFKSSDVSFLEHRCITCAGKTYVCSHNTTGTGPVRDTENRTLELEQIANTRIIDGSRRIKAKLGQFLPTNISQEFLLRDYFRSERYPDILLFQTPLLHEVYFGLNQSPGNKDKLRDPLKELQKLVEKYVPSTTSVYWLPNQDIADGDPHASVRNPLLRESIDVFSQEMESVLGSSSNNIFPFFDLFELSRPVKSLHNAEDALHMKPEWYDTIAKYILELHCNS